MIASSTMNEDLYSIRMRASSGGYHLSGAERLVSKSRVDRVASELTRRGLDAADGKMAKINCCIETIDHAAIQYAVLPDLEPFQVPSHAEGRILACELLESAGVPKEVASMAVDLLREGPGPGGSVMRGAVILDIATGKRLEEDPARGVRVSRMDLTDACRDDLQQNLSLADLGHRRVIEALTLAGKVIAAPGIRAELCWSDDPGYTSGYVASPGRGYQRISALKALGDPLGGRVFFFDQARAAFADCLDYLEKQPVLFDTPGKIHPQVKWDNRHG